MAQTDVTSTYIANPSFELSAPGTALTASVLTSYSSGGAVTGDPKTGIYGWTVSYSQAAPTYVNLDVLDATTASGSPFGSPVTPANGTYSMFFRHGWAPNTVDTFKTTSLSALIEGKYSMTLAYKGVGAGGTTTSSLGISVVESGKKLATVTSPAFQQYSNTNATTYFTTTSWQKLTIPFSVTAAGNVNFVLTLNGNGSNRTDVLVDSIVLTYNGIDHSDLITEISTATNLLSSLPSSSDAYTNLNTAITAAQTVNNNTNATMLDLTQAISQLQLAEKSASTLITAASALNKEISTATTLLATLSTSSADYTSLNSAITAAQVVSNKANVTATELTSALMPLQIAEKSASAGLCEASLTNPVATNFVTNGTFDSNTNGWSYTTGAQNHGTASNQTGAFTGNFWENWNPSGYTGKLYQTIAGIPNGTYLLKIAAFVNTLGTAGTQYVYANADKTNLTSTTPTAYTVVTYVSNDTIECGFAQTATATNWCGIDNISLSYYSSANIVAQVQNIALYTAWKDALNAAIAARDNSAYTNVIGVEKTALVSAINNNTTDPASADGYVTAKNALAAATSAFVSGASSYDGLVKEISNATSLGIDVAAATAVSTDPTTTSAIALSKAQELKVSEYSAVVTGYPGNVTSSLATWADTNINPSNKGQHWDGTTTTTYFENNTWSSSSWTSTRTQTVNLPAGKYVLKAAGRASGAVALSMSVTVNSLESVVSFPSNNDIGLGISTDGVTNFSATGTYANSNNGRGWEWRYLPFELTEATDVTIKFTGITSTIHQWYSVSDVAILSKTEATSIGNVNTDLITPFKVFNLNGQQVRSNATSTKGLNKGVYIINGKKVVVK